MPVNDEVFKEMDNVAVSLLYVWKNLLSSYKDLSLCTQSLVQFWNEFFMKYGWNDEIRVYRLTSSWEALTSYINVHKTKPTQTCIFTLSFFKLT